MYILLHLTEGGISMTFHTEKETAIETFDDVIDQMKANGAEEEEILHLFEAPSVSFSTPIEVNHNGQLKGAESIKKHVPFAWSHEV